MQDKKRKILKEACMAGVFERDIASAFGVSRQAINQYLVNHGIWNDLENRRLRATEKMKKEVKGLSTV